MRQDEFGLLVVDDNEDNRYTLTRRLAREGYTNVTTAENGRQALDVLRSRRFDLVLLDIMMPEVNGYQVLEALKADQKLRHLPVIMISAVDELDSVIRCIELGAEDYLPKPFNPTLLKARIGACLEKKRLRDEVMAHLVRMEHELETARELQMSMVPAAFPVPTPDRPVEVFAVMEPARQVGGDLYDFFYTDDERFYFLIGDVSDKGAPAALFMARTKTLVRLVATLSRAPDGGAPSLRQVMERVNEELCRDNELRMFVTLFLGLLDPASGQVTYCNAGHPPPYILGRTDGIVRIEDARGKPLGIRRVFQYESVSRQLAPGESLLLFTDGITEATDPQGRLFSEERLQDTLRGVASQRPAKVVTTVVGKIREFAADAAPSDDFAVLAVRFGL